ncbi:hypothetical protein [Streptomyces sp. MH13]|uniref:hypothetical protein n=1 Tax=Streptomyces sp. MH13 TaxID=3417651 RepID=UPI003CE75D9B
MALMAGELMVLLNVDANGVGRGLSQAERAMRQAGQVMGDDAERAGQRAGQQLGDGVTEGLDGIRTDAARVGRQAGDDLGDTMARSTVAQLRDARGRFVAAGQDAGQAVGEGLQDGGEQGADAATETMGDRMKSRMTMAAAGIGVAAGAVLMQSFQDAMDQGQLVGKLQAQLGATPAEAQRYGKIAGKLYTGAVTDTFEEGTQAIRHAMQSGLVPPDATNAQIASITRKVTDLSKAFGVDLADATVAVGQMIRTGMVKDASEGLDLIGKTFQVNDKRADDMLETLNEYPTQFRDLGITGSQALGIMQQGFDGASKDSDKVADALKELNIRVQSLDAADGLKKLKIDANEAAAAFAEGGPTAANMLDRITDRLRGVTDKSERYRIAQEVLGTQSEDLAGALMAIDPSEADKRLGKFKGTVDAAGDALRDNAGTKVKQFQRGLQQGVVDFLGGTVIPGLTSVGQKIGSIWDTATKGIDGASLGAKLAAFVPMLGDQIAAKVAEIGPKIAEGLANAGQRVAEWAMANPTAFFKVAAIAGAFLLALAFLPELLIAGVATTVGLIIGGFVGKLILAAQEKLPELGTAVADWFGGLWSTYVSGPVSRTWSSFITSVQDLPRRASIALAGLGMAIVARASSAWQSFRDTTVQRALSVVSWVRNLPRLISQGVGYLGSLLTGKGRDVVMGLWRGIRSMGGWLKSTLTSWAGSIIPGPVAKALGISSPSKVMAQQVGRWIPRGIVAGIESTQGEVDRTMANLVSTPTPAMNMSASVGGAVNGGHAGGSTGGARPVVLKAGDAFGDLVISTIRQEVKKGGASQNVPVFLGGYAR